MAGIYLKPATAEAIIDALGCVPKGLRDDAWRRAVRAAFLLWMVGLKGPRATLGQIGRRSLGQAIDRGPRARVQRGAA